MRCTNTDKEIWLKIHSLQLCEAAVSTCGVFFCLKAPEINLFESSFCRWAVRICCDVGYTFIILILSNCTFAQRSKTSNNEAKPAFQIEIYLHFSKLQSMKAMPSNCFKRTDRITTGFDWIRFKVSVHSAIQLHNENNAIPWWRINPSTQPLILLHTECPLTNHSN